MYWFMNARAVDLFSACILRASIRFVCGYVKCGTLSRSMCVPIDRVWLVYCLY
jgi:hypothetical protein